MISISDIELDYDALTIDTCIFDEHGILLEKGLLKQLEQFSDSPIIFVLADIVHFELKSHLSAKIKEARNKISEALGVSESLLLANREQIDSAKALLFGVGIDDEIAEKRLSTFYKNSGATIIKSSEYVEISRLIKRYFEVLPPFENIIKKKNEFPDALSLLSLEAWAEKNDVKVLAVSKDKGWMQFAEHSERIDVIEKLSDALAHFQPQLQPYNAAKNIINEFRSLISSGKENDILSAITSSIVDSIDGVNVSIDASSSFYYDYDDVEVEYLNHSFIEDPSGFPEINLIRVDTDLIVFQLTVNVECEVSCSFSFSVRDSIDKDYISIGNSYISKKETYLTDILVSLAGNFSGKLNDVEVKDIEVLEALSCVDFEYVEPDWGYEE